MCHIFAYLLFCIDKTVEYHKHHWMIIHHFIMIIMLFLNDFPFINACICLLCASARGKLHSLCSAIFCLKHLCCFNYCCCIFIKKLCASVFVCWAWFRQFTRPFPMTIPNRLWLYRPCAIRCILSNMLCTLWFSPLFSFHFTIASSRWFSLPFGCVFSFNLCPLIIMVVKHLRFSIAWRIQFSQCKSICHFSLLFRSLFHSIEDWRIQQISTEMLLQNARAYTCIILNGERLVYAGIFG